MRKTRNAASSGSAIFAVALTCAWLVGCGPGGGGPSGAGGGGKQLTIANVGSDTMLQLGMAWSEAYRQVEPGVSVEVTGGGSGVGIAGLINGSVDLANSSRAFEEEEIADLKAKQNKEPKEFVVGHDALSIYVHKDNPLSELSLEQLGEIYKKDGQIRKWSDLGVSNIPGAKGDEIIVVSRQNNSGTHHYFREAVIGKKNDQRLDTVNQNGSKDVVDLVGKTPNAIGYSGMGYKTDAVKVLKVSRKKGEPAVAPSLPTTLDKSYPISRPMFLYTAGEPAPHIRKYIDWILSDAGEVIVKEQGYVPLPRK